MKNEDIAHIHSAAAEISRLLKAANETENPLEQQAAKDVLFDFIKATGSDHLVQFARNVLEEKIHRETFIFVDATAHFYDNADHATRAAERCDLITRLNQEHAAFLESPSVARAEKMLALFENFTAENPLPEQPEDAESGIPPIAEDANRATHQTQI